MSIYINGEKLSEQPNTLTETRKTISNTQQAINGNKQNITVGTTRSVEMGWTYIKPAFAKILEDLESGHAPVEYYNDDSKKYGELRFEGIISVTVGAYVRGGSGLVPCTVKIEEGESF